MKPLFSDSTAAVRIPMRLLQSSALLLLYPHMNVISFFSSFLPLIVLCCTFHFLNNVSTPLFLIFSHSSPFFFSLVSHPFLTSPLFSSPSSHFPLCPYHPLMSIKVRIMRGNISSAYTRSGHPAIHPASQHLDFTNSHVAFKVNDS